MSRRNAQRLALSISILVGTLGAGVSYAAQPFSFDSAPGRLPKNVVPLDYSIDLVPDIKARSIAGRESVELDFREASATIQFNTVNETLSRVLLDGRPVKQTVTDNKLQLTTVTLARPAPIGKHRLTFTYVAKIEPGPPGLYAQDFVKPGGGKGFLISTKFEPVYARRMFPCWDEPAFRSTFELSVTVPAAWKTVANMPIAKRVEHGALATTRFVRTPKMPTYLVEFTAGDLRSLEAETDGTKIGVWAASGQEQDGAVALANAQQILHDYNEYFDYPYPLPKLDSIAIPGGFTGAMENWGAITYNDQLLLITPSSTQGDRQTVYSVQAHEMAHQWNGDLVTMGWWDDLWLNESFASWRAAKETDLRNPSWNWWESEDESKERAMLADARASSHSIEQHVTDELQAQNAFDPDITYNKGQAVLRMFEAYVGPDAFRDGIRLYMKAHAFSNSSSADLWNALGRATGRDIGAIAAGWTEQAGYPLVTVQAHCDAGGVRTLALSQSRFLLQGKDPGTSHWSIPLQIRSGGASQAQTVLLTEDGQSVAAGRCDETLSVNAGTIGFYRALYDDATLALNTKGLATIPRADRIALYDDEWALVESGKQPLPNYLHLVAALGSDLNERAWFQITQSLDLIEFDERGTPGHDAFATYARSLIHPVYEKLGWESKPDETPGIQALRRTVMRDLGEWGDPEVIAEARRRFTAFVADRNAIRPDDQETILRIVARSADATTFEQLHTIARDSKNETELRRAYVALMTVNDPQLAEAAVKIALSPEIPPQAAALRLQLIAQLNAQHPQLSWKTFTENQETLLAPHQPYGPLIMAQYLPEFYWTALPLDDLEAWLKAHIPAQMAPNLARGMETARLRLAEKTALVQAADQFLSSSKTARN
jgi:aminopeptidase N